MTNAFIICLFRCFVAVVFVFFFHSRIFALLAVPLTKLFRFQLSFECFCCTRCVVGISRLTFYLCSGSTRKRHINAANKKPLLTMDVAFSVGLLWLTNHCEFHRIFCIFTYTISLIPVKIEFEFSWISFENGNLWQNLPKLIRITWESGNHFGLVTT